MTGKPLNRLVNVKTATRPAGDRQRRRLRLKC